MVPDSRFLGAVYEKAYLGGRLFVPELRPGTMVMRGNIFKRPCCAFWGLSRGSAEEHRKACYYLSSLTALPPSR